jgi:prolyl-tRNA editing enzyme YbaK/EbsC (Cys-tRNA(Pro) deacylase)
VYASYTLTGILGAAINTCLYGDLMPLCLATANGGTMKKKLKSSARKVQEALDAHNLSCEVVQMTDTTRSASDAARAVGCQVGQIVKSLIFEGQQSHQPILVAASGANRVNERAIEKSVSESVKMAKPDYVRQMTGFAIGGVPPVGHDHPLKIFIDEDLLQYDEIWAAAGTPHAVFKLTPEDLKMITSGKIISVK